MDSPDVQVLYSQPYRPNGSDDWEKYKATIAELYQANELRLVMKEMGVRHHLKATERQYKAKLREWGLDRKHIKGPEYKYMVQKRARRKQNEGKETQFYIGDKAVSSANIQRYIKRNKIDENNIFSSIVATPRGFTYLTPPSTFKTINGTTEPSCANLPNHSGPPCRRDGVGPSPLGRAPPSSVYPNRSIQQSSMPLSPSCAWMERFVKLSGSVISSPVLQNNEFGKSVSPIFTSTISPIFSYLDRSMQKTSSPSNPSAISYNT
ncbi:MAG: hypothetical protein M1834_000550 [Cirrosporium novae-zelandiae]|nr:MAG: hypothetical protein M1834_000550 [Cirrosporium novae-zelandiae]